MNYIHSLTGENDLSTSLAKIIGPFLATAGVLKLVLGRWWTRTLSPSTPTDPKPEVPTTILNTTSAIEVLASIALLYHQLRLSAAIILLCMIAFLEFENWRKGTEKLGWKMRIPALVVTTSLVIIVITDITETDEEAMWIRSKRIWDELGNWKIRRWAGLEGREVGFDF
jgi:hypothetical protein